MDEWHVPHLGHDGSQVLAIHAALISSGQVLYFSGSEHDADQQQAGLLDHSRLWDPVSGVITKIDSPHHDLFCSGHAFLGDGRLLVAGGTRRYKPDYKGLCDTTIFDDAAAATGHPWRPATPMHFGRGTDTGGGRWYPSLLTLGDGRVLAVSGLCDDGDVRGFNTMIEIFTTTPAPAGRWSDEGDQPDMPDGYPRLHLLPDGRIFFASPMAGLSRTYEPVPRRWADVAPGPGPEYQGYKTSSVLLPLEADQGYRARVMVIGREHPRVIDLGDPHPQWHDTGPRALPGSPARQYACPVLLPDGTVLVVGGSPTDADADAVRVAEIYDPATGAWSFGGAAEVPRVYHNVALLLPDGRVWTAGSNHNGAQGHHNRELRVELYSPAYLFRGQQSTIVSAPDVLRVPSGLPSIDTFVIETAQADDIASVALLRCGSVTHAFDADQRHVGLSIVARTPTTLTVQAPPTTEIAPPGWYLLFVVDGDGVPSIGRFVRIEALTWSEPVRVPGWFGAETAGGGVALTDVNGDGHPDLVVFHVDDPGGENAGHYRVGWDLDATGHAATWSEPMAVPGWFGAETAGGDVAAADINGDGHPDLVVFHIDDPDGENAGHYRVGWDLDATGHAATWSEPMPVPGWFGNEAAGAGVALADLNGSGRPDLVVFHVDNPGGENAGWYRIGWDLDTAGRPASWSDPVRIPGWFGDETAGAGDTLADVNGNGRPDLVVFHVDDPGGENVGWYRVGLDLDAAGMATAWSGAIGVPGWFGMETAGAGLASADLDGNGRPDLVAFHVDDPEGENAGWCRVLPRVTTPDPSPPLVRQPSGRITAPLSSTVQPGLCATSHGWPSGSMNTPE